MTSHIHIPDDIKRLYEVHDYRHAAAILACEFPAEAAEVYQVLRASRFTANQVKKPGRDERGISREFSKLLRPLGWTEGELTVKLIVDDEEISADTHRIDYLKNKIAFDLECDGKDRTFDQDLSAFQIFFDYYRISLGILVAQSQEWNTGLFHKHGANIMCLEKLLSRQDSGRSGGCPILIFGITTRLLNR